MTLAGNQDAARGRTCLGKERGGHPASGLWACPKNTALHTHPRGRDGSNFLRKRWKGNNLRRDYWCTWCCSVRHEREGRRKHIGPLPEQNKEARLFKEHKFPRLRAGLVVFPSVSVSCKTNKRRNRSTQRPVEPLHLLAPAPRGGVSPPSSPGHETILFLSRLPSLPCSLCLLRIVAGREIVRDALFVPPLPSN